MQSRVRTAAAASSFLQIEGLLRLKAVRLYVCTLGVRLSKPVGGVCRMALAPWPAWLSGYKENVFAAVVSPWALCSTRAWLSTAH